jgi:hypothetical protein
MLDAFKGYNECGRFDFGVLSCLIIFTSKEVTVASLSRFSDNPLTLI